MILTVLDWCNHEQRAMATKRTLSGMIAILLISTLSSCTWIKLTPEARDVREVSLNEVTDCEKLGTTRVATIASYGPFDRYAKSINEELSALARGNALDLGGNTIAPLTGVEDGRRTYAVFRCPQEKSVFPNETRNYAYRK